MYHVPGRQGLAIGHTHSKVQERCVKIAFNAMIYHFETYSDLLDIPLTRGTFMLQFVIVIRKYTSLHDISTANRGRAHFI